MAFDFVILGSQQTCGIIVWGLIVYVHDLYPFLKALPGKIPRYIIPPLATKKNSPKASTDAATSSVLRLPCCGQNNGTDPTNPPRLL